MTLEAPPGRYINSDALSNFSIVLIEPENSLNIGSVARAMKNLGFKNLVLVAPSNYDPSKAKITACWADNIIDQCIVFEKVEEALSDMSDVVGFTSSFGKNRRNCCSLTDWTEQLAKEGAHDQTKRALCFGPESTGLRKDHIPHFRLLINITSTVECPSFNLSQAALLAMYEVSKLQWQEGGDRSDAQPATMNDIYQMDKLVERLGVESRFFRDGTPQAVPGIVQNLFRRIQPDKREVGILLGLLSRLVKELEFRGK